MPITEIGRVESSLSYLTSGFATYSLVTGILFSLLSNGSKFNLPAFFQPVDQISEKGNLSFYRICKTRLFVR